jgi:hypothetical protein
MPEPEYRNYGTVFMSAMQRELIWLYKGDIPEVVPPSISTGFCIRTDKGFSNAGSSNRHLKCFEMLTLAGQMPEEQMLESIIDLLKEKIPSDTTIIANLHPDDEIAQIFFKERNISFLLKEKCHFREPDKTDREGHRVEINLKAVRDEQEIQWEVFNCVVITSTDNGEKKLSTPLIEASGSLERILAFSEGKDHVLKTGRFSLDSVVSTLPSVDIQAVYKFTDLLRTIIILNQSGYNLGQSIRKSDKRQLLYITACNELILHCLMNNISFETVKKLIKQDFELIKSFGYNCDEIILQRLIQELAETLARLTKKIENIRQYIRSAATKVGIKKAEERALSLYDGDSKRLLPIIKR